MHRIVEESSTISTRLGSVARMQSSVSRRASSTAAGRGMMLSTPEGRYDCDPPQTTTSGAGRRLRAACTIAVMADGERLALMRKMPTPPFGMAKYSGSCVQNTIGTAALAVPCAQSALSLFYAPSSSIRSESNSSLIRLIPAP